MSKENMKKFYEALAQDEALAGELDERIAKATIEFAAEKGFEFTSEDLSKLSDDELDNVNGGFIGAGSVGRWNESERKERIEKIKRGEIPGAVPDGRGASGGW